MSDADSPDTKNTTSTTTAAAASTFIPTWKLYDGIEDDVTMGIIRTTAGIAIGGIAGLMLFKSGKGNRAMSVAAGVGVALGCTYERARAKPPASLE